MSAAMQDILRYLSQKYAPLSIIVYGSFARGQNAADSDFDALVITACGERGHDSTAVGGTQLDVIIYPAAMCGKDCSCCDFIQIYGGHVALDSGGGAQTLLERVTAFVDNYPKKSAAENAQNVEWCEKMLRRTQRGDADANYRWHWLLVDSLEIYFDLCGMFYFGPKKALSEMSARDPQAAELYAAALAEFTPEPLQKWVEFLRQKAADLCF